MFDNFGTALVQAVGFFSVFGFFVYQLLSDGNKTTSSNLKSPSRSINEPKVLNKPKKKGLFGKKIEPTKDEVKPKKKGLFSKEQESVQVIEKPKKKRWF